MSTLNALITRAGEAGRPGSTGRAGRLAALLIAAGTLAAGCGSVSAGNTAGPGSPAGSSGSAASGGAVHSSATATPTGAPAPVPTVTGGSPAAGGAACVGWPSGVASGPLPASFVPVSVERCANGATTVPGKGLWTTATLQRSAGDLSRLVSALRQPSAIRKPGTICPALAMIPPQVVLVDAAGQKLIPTLPRGDCGLVSTAVLIALDALDWQPVSVRLIAPVSRGADPGGTNPGGANETMPVTSVATPQPVPTMTRGNLHP